MPAAGPPRPAPTPVKPKLFVDLAFRQRPGQAKPANLSLAVGLLHAKGEKPPGIRNVVYVDVNDPYSSRLLTTALAFPVMGKSWRQKVIKALLSPDTEQTRRVISDAAEEAADEISRFATVFGTAVGHRAVAKWKKYEPIRQIAPTIVNLNETIQNLRSAFGRQGVVAPSRFVVATAIGKMITSPETMTMLRTSHHHVFEQNKYMLIANDLTDRFADPKRFFRVAPGALAREIQVSGLRGISEAGNEIERMVRVAGKLQRQRVTEPLDAVLASHGLGDSELAPLGIGAATSVVRKAIEPRQLVSAEKLAIEAEKQAIEAGATPQTIAAPAAQPVAKARRTAAAKPKPKATATAAAAALGAPSPQAPGTSQAAPTVLQGAPPQPQTVLQGAPPTQGQQNVLQGVPPVLQGAPGPQPGQTILQGSPPVLQGAPPVLQGAPVIQGRPPVLQGQPPAQQTPPPQPSAPPPTGAAAGAAGATQTAPAEQTVGAAPPTGAPTTGAEPPPQPTAAQSMEELALSVLGKPPVGPPPSAEAAGRRVVRVTPELVGKILDSEAGRKIVNQALKARGLPEIQAAPSAPTQQAAPETTAPAPAATPAAAPAEATPVAAGAAAEAAGAPAARWGWTPALLALGAGYLLNPAINALLRNLGILPPQEKEEEKRIMLTTDLPQDLLGGRPIDAGSSLVYPGFYAPQHPRFFNPYQPYGPDWYELMLRSIYQ